MDVMKQIWGYAISDGVPRRSLMVALVVGTIINLINRGDAMEDTDLQAQIRADESPSRPAGSGVATIISQEKLIPREKLADVPGRTKDISLVKPARLTLTVQVVDVPPGGRVPEHHHGGPTIDYVLSGTVRMQLLGGPALVYQPGQTLSSPWGRYISTLRTPASPNRPRSC